MAHSNPFHGEYCKPRTTFSRARNYLQPLLPPRKSNWIFKWMITGNVLLTLPTNFWQSLKFGLIEEEKFFHRISLFVPIINTYQSYTFIQGWDRNLEGVQKTLILLIQLLSKKGNAISRNMNRKVSKIPISFGEYNLNFPVQ